MIDTPRLVLRRPDPGDWPAYRAYRLSPRTTGAMDEHTAWTHFAAFFGHWQLRGFGRFVACLRDGGRPVGHFGPYFTAAHSEPELTWTLWDAALEGQGLAHEAALAVRAHAFGVLGWPTAVSLIHPANLRSQALARRLGATAENAALGDLQVWRHRRAA